MRLEVTGQSQRVLRTFHKPEASGYKSKLSQSSQKQTTESGEKYSASQVNMTGYLASSRGGGEDDAQNPVSRADGGTHRKCSHKTPA